VHNRTLAGIDEIRPRPITLPIKQKAQRDAAEKNHSIASTLIRQ